MHRPILVAIIISAFASLPTTHAADLSPRQTQRFDSDWRFFKGDATNAQAPAFDDHSWRSVDLPHDWSIEDLAPLTNAVSEPALYVTQGAWHFRKGDDPVWKEPGASETGWETVTLPATWEEHSGYTNDNVYGWYRRNIAVPESYRGQDVWLELGRIDDVDQTYFNGQLVGSTGSFPPDFKTAYSERRRYRVPKELIRYGAENTVAVRVFDGYGGGGMVEAAIPRVVSGPFDSEAPGAKNTAFTIGGTGWYRKHFMLPKEARGQTVTVQFDGVYMNADVWINGQHLGEHPYGYTSFSFDLSPHLRFGDEENVLAVRVRNEGRNSRWYSGSGIYRHVWLNTAGPVHIAHWGTFITTPEVSADKAIVRVQTTLNNETGKRTDATLVTTLLDAESNTVASRTITTRLSEQTPPTIDQQFEVTAPRLWFPESPALYRAVCEVMIDGKTLDRSETVFGIRSIRFDADKGFFLNGRSLKLKGGCVHANNGPLGAAAFDRAEERRIELLKAAGFNTVRCAHNPPSPAFLEACDRLGMMAIDEAFDAWAQAHIPGMDDYHVIFKEWWQRDFDSMIRRDRNHPAIILWSIGNQIAEAGKDSGARTARELAEYVRAMDPTRAVTANVLRQGSDWRDMEPFFAALDVAGYSYARAYYDEDHKRLPNRVIFSSEIDSGNAFENWMAVLDRDFVCGNFDWTAFDYMGEVGLGWWNYAPTLSAAFSWSVNYSGDLDICGYKRPRSYYRDALWSGRPEVSAFIRCPVPSFEGPGKSAWGWDDVKASWTWPKWEGKPLQVDVYSSCDRVQLKLNGKDLGTKATSRETQFKAAWQVPYEPGTLIAIGYTNNIEAARWELRTAGPPSGLRLTADRTTLKADGQDLCYVTVEVVDANGVRDPNGEKLVRFSVEGEGTLAAVGNSKPTSLESFQQPQRTTYDGRCLAILKSTHNAGDIKLTARSDGLAESCVAIKTQAN